MTCSAGLLDVLTRPHQPCQLVGCKYTSLLPSTHPDIHKEFTNGSCVLNRTDVFSSITQGFAHEQVKVKEGAAVGLLENPTVLRRWMIAGPEIARIIQEIEETSSKITEEKRQNHERVPTVQACFEKDVLPLVSSRGNRNSPFNAHSRPPRP